MGKGGLEKRAKRIEGEDGREEVDPLFSLPRFHLVPLIPKVLCYEVRRQLPQLF